MKLTFSWLKDHLDTSATVEEIAAKLSTIGLEVESIADPAAALAPFTVARVLEAKQHPNADKLRVAQVDTGKGVVEVVCGAPNCRTGMVGVFAPIGSYIPGTKITLDKRPVRGVVSNGMLVSERELELSDDHDGIIELGAEYGGKLGQRYVDVMGLADPVLEVKLTPNRPDCTGVRGIARDLAAAGLGKLKPEKKLGKVEGDADCPIDIRLEFAPETARACPVFAGRYVAGVKNGQSPAWMQARLKAVGLRPISALVDITNYISLDRGRPLHVYDADKLKGAIRARLGKAGETFRALDNKDYTVDAEACVIADDSGPLGLGGIIGGEASGCTAGTTNVLIECAYFDPVRIAATGRRHGVQTDARYRFERGVDPAFILPGLDLATALVLELCGGKPSKAKVAGKVPSPKTVIDFEPARVEKLTGLKLGDSQVRGTLEALGFHVDGKGAKVKVTAPSWRPDVHGSADLVEEVARIAGLDTVPATPLPRLKGVTAPVLTERQRRVKRARRLLAARGMVEAVTWSFIPKALAQHFGGGADALDLANPISVDMSAMRPSLLPGLVAAAHRNRNRGFVDLALFEVGQAYRGTKAEEQLTIAAAIRTGSARTTGSGRHWDRKAVDVDAFDAKADVVALLAGLGIDAGKAQITRDAPSWYHPGHAGTLRLGPKLVLAHFGALHPATLATLDLPAPAVAFELFIEALPPEKRRATRARPAFAVSDLLALKRDFAFVVDTKVAAADIIRAAQSADRKAIEAVSVFDVFEGESLGAGRKSIAVEVTIGQRDKTLTDAEIEAIAQRVVAEVKKGTGAEIRG